MDRLSVVVVIAAISVCALFAYASFGVVMPSVAESIKAERAERTAALNVLCLDEQFYKEANHWRDCVAVGFAPPEASQ